MSKWFGRKKLVLLGVMLVVVLGIVGCGSANEETKLTGENDTETNAVLKGSIQIAGSTSVQPLSEELAARFMELNRGVKIDVAGGGSSAGVKAASEGTADIGASSRALKAEEKNLGLKETIIAMDGIAVVVNANNSVTSLTLEQVKKVYTGEITNWKVLGGKDVPITVINREEGSGTRGAFEEIVLGKDGKFTEKAAIQNSTGAVRTAVAQDEYAIGYISMGTISKEVRPVKVDGVDPTEENVINDSYKIARPYLYLTKGTVNETTQAFIDWILSPEGQAIVGEDFVPVK